MKKQANNKKRSKGNLIADTEIIDINSGISESIEPIDSSSKKAGKIVEPDDRFLKPKNKKDSPIGAKFKENIAKENKLRKNKEFKNKLFGNVLRMVNTPSIFRFLDFSLNIFSIGTIIFSVFLTLKYLAQSNPYMVITGCLMIYVSIYLNEKIN